MSKIHIGTVVILFVVLAFKGTIVSFFVPMAGAPLEVYHYRIADSHGIADQVPGGSTGIIRKELSLLIRYSEQDMNRIGQRNHHDARKLTADLKKTGARALVTTNSYLPSIEEFPGYYTLLRIMLESIRGMEIRWRWFVLRLFHLIITALACVLTIRTADFMGTTERSAAIWTGFVFVSGPVFGFDGSLLGPHAILVCLWAFFIWRAMIFLRSYTLLDAAFMAIAAFAMSSMHIHGFIAFMVVVVIYCVGVARLRGRSRLTMAIPFIFVIVGIVAWVFRGISHQDVIAEEYRNANTLVSQLFSRSTWSAVPADSVLYVWVAVTLAGIAGIYIYINANRIKHIPIFLPALPIVFVGIFAIIYPDVFMAWGSLGPLFALILGTGLSELSTRYRVIWIILVVMVFIDLYDLLYQIVRIYS